MIARAWDQLDTRWQALILREKLLTASGIGLLLVLLLVTTLVDSFRAHQRNEQALHKSQTDTDRARQRTALLASQLNRQPTPPPAATSENLPSLLTQAGVALLTPEDMRQVITALVRRYPHIQLLRFGNLPPTPLGVGKPLLWRHTLELEIAGPYFDVVRYLQALEAYRGVYWEALDYEVKSWPDNRVKVKLFGLGTEEVLLRA